MKSFNLSDIQKKSLKQQNEIKNVVEYDWKNLNVIRLKPSKTYSVGDSDIQFQLDTTRLANNYPLNRIKMNARIRVTCTAAAGRQFDTPGYDLATGFMIVKNANTFYQPYLMSPSNGALDAFFLNKAFSNVSVKNGANDMREDKRNFAKIDLLGRFMSEDKLSKWGIYPDYEKGSYDEKYSASFEHLPFYSGSGTLATDRFPVYSIGSTTSDLDKNIFWKRNTNNQYIKQVSNKVKTSAGAFLNTITPPEAQLPLKLGLNHNSSLPQIYKINPQIGDGSKEYYYGCFPDGTFKAVNGVSQQVEFDIEEDLITDFTTTRYNKYEEFRALPSSLLNFNFTISSLIDQLYKTSNVNIGTVKVEILDPTLDFFTFNYGLLSIQPKQYYVPYYQENQVSEQIVVSPTTTSNPPLQTLKFNKTPTYILLYCEENIATGQNRATNLNTLAIDSLKLTIDNDQGTALYGLNKTELEEMTLNNMGNEFANFEAMHRTNKWASPNEPFYKFMIDAFAPGSQIITMSSQQWATYLSTYVTPTRSYIEGVYLLKIGKDIRIDSRMMAGLARPTSFTFDITVDKQWAKNAIPGTATFKAVAFTPSYYIMDPQNGLLTTKDITYTEDELLAFITNTNREVAEKENMENKQVYDTNHPQMMLGSGWFGGLNAMLKHKY